MSTSPQAGTSRTPASRSRALRERRERRDRTLKHVVQNGSPSSLRQDASVQFERPASASRMLPRHQIDRDSSVSTTSKPSGNDSAGIYPISGRIERRQSAPEQLQRSGNALSAVAEIDSRLLPPSTAPQNAPWHRPSSPVLRKLGDTTFQYTELKGKKFVSYESYRKPHP